MKKVIVWTGCVLMAVTSQAAPKRWIPIGQAANGAMLFMERPTLGADKDVPAGFNPYKTSTTWVKTISPEAKASTGAKPKYASSLQRIEFDCKRKQIAIKRAVYYDLDGEVIKDDPSPSSRLDDPIPESLGEMMLSAVCTWIELSKMPPPNQDDKDAESKL